MDNFKSFTATNFLRNLAKSVIGLVYLSVGKPGLKSFPIVFVVHEVTDSPFAHPQITNTFCSEKVFQIQMGVLMKYFDFISLQEDELKLPKKGCLITFDDGYLSSRAATEKYLVKNNIQSVHFWNTNTLVNGINTSAIEHLNSFRENRLPDWSKSNPSQKIFQERIPDKFAGPYLTLEQARNFSTICDVLIGDHGMEHFYSPNLSRDELVSNLCFSELNNISGIEFLPLWAAPHSAINDVTVETLASLGCKIVFGGNQYFQFKDTQVVPRVDLNETLKSKFRILGAIAITLVRHYLMSFGNKKEEIRFRD